MLLRKKIYPIKKAPWWRFEIVVFETFGEMYEYGMTEWATKGKDLGTDYRAIMLGLRPPLGRLLGEILLCKKDLSMNTISHEVSHAAWWYLQCVKGKEAMMALVNREGVTHNDEELLADLIGGMIGQVEEIIAKSSLYCD